VILVALSATRVLGAESAPLRGAALAAAKREAQAAAKSLTEGTPTFDSHHAFTVTEGRRRVEVLPMRYPPRRPAPLANVDHCALAIVSPNHHVQIVRTVGVGYTETLGCTALDAIGFPDLDGDGRFEIVLIQSTLAPPDRYLKTPIVVRRQTSGDFGVDESLTAALDEQGGITSIGALRRAASEHLRRGQQK
jgi:hypothetical protein